MRNRLFCNDFLLFNWYNIYVMKGGYNEKAVFNRSGCFSLDI